MGTLNLAYLTDTICIPTMLAFNLAHLAPVAIPSMFARCLTQIADVTLARRHLVTTWKLTFLASTSLLGPGMTAVDFVEVADFAMVAFGFPFVHALLLARIANHVTFEILETFFVLALHDWLQLLLETLYLGQEA